MAGIPPFYITRTLLGFDPGEPDRNRVSLNMPNDRRFVLCDMGEDRTDKDVKRWNAMAAELSALWEKK